MGQEMQGNHRRYIDINIFSIPFWQNAVSFHVFVFKILIPTNFFTTKNIHLLKEKHEFVTKTHLFQKCLQQQQLVSRFSSFYKHVHWFVPLSLLSHFKQLFPKLKTKPSFITKRGPKGTLYQQRQDLHICSKKRLLILDQNFPSNAKLLDHLYLKLHGHWMVHQSLNHIPGLESVIMLPIKGWLIPSLT